MYHARDLVVALASEDAQQQPGVSESDGSVRPEWREDWYDGLGYCKHILGASLRVLYSYLADWSQAPGTPWASS
jgi:hypothetical protein